MMDDDDDDVVEVELPEFIATKLRFETCRVKGCGFRVVVRSEAAGAAATADHQEWAHRQAPS